MFQMLSLNASLTAKDIIDLDGPRTKLVQWNTASNRKRPAIVFVPGFLSEYSIESKQNVWRQQIQQLAKKNDFASYGLYWPSQTLFQNLEADSWTSTVSSIDNMAGIGGGMIAGQLAMGLGFGVFTGVAIFAVHRALKTWNSAIDEATTIAGNIDWMYELDRPIFLIGHSLGGRIAIQMTEYTTCPNLRSVFALAPAVEEYKTNLDAFYRSQTSPGAIVYSQNDLTLQVLFRLGEKTQTLPLGFNPIKNNSRYPIPNINLSTFNNQPINHNTYSSICVELFNSGLLGIPLSART